MYYHLLTLTRRLKTITWEKDTHGLFDYDSVQLIARTFKQNKSFRVFRDNVDVNISDEDTGSLGKLIANIGLIKDDYWVYDISNNEDKEPILLVLKDYIHNGQSGIKLKFGDIIKMGKCRYLVKEIVRNTEKSTNISPRNKEEHMKDKVSIETKSEIVNFYTQNAVPSNEDDEMNCRICLCFKSTNENPIISLPCKCSGSVAFIHANCLQEWLRSKIEVRKNEDCAQYSWKDFECDICKTLFPSIIGENGNR